MQEQQKLDVEAIKTLTLAIAESGTAVGKIMEDNKVSLGDLMHLRALVSGVAKFRSVDYAALMPQAKDVDAAEAAELSALFTASFDLPGADTVEANVEAGFAVLMTALEALSGVWSIFDKVKKPA